MTRKRTQNVAQMAANARLHPRGSVSRLRGYGAVLLLAGACVAALSVHSLVQSNVSTDAPPALPVLDDVTIATSAIKAAASAVVVTKFCSAWGCTCQGLSDMHGAWVWYRVEGIPNAVYAWWAQHQCRTMPRSVFHRYMTAMQCDARDGAMSVVRSALRGVQLMSTTARACEAGAPQYLGDDGINAHLTSQSQEDLRLLGWFCGLCNGTYIEMGAVDGLRYSNSHAFASTLGWRGVLIEPAPDSFKRLEQNRPNELALINAAVCDSAKTVHWVQLPPQGAGAVVRGIWEFATPSFRKQWWRGITPTSRPDLTHEIKCSPLASLLREAAGGTLPSFYDFYSLDVEGAELAVLKTVDWDHMRFGVILVEADEHNPRKNAQVIAILDVRGYRVVDVWQRSTWFVSKTWKHHYPHLPIPKPWPRPTQTMNGKSGVYAHVHPRGIK